LPIRAQTAPRNRFSNVSEAIMRQAQKRVGMKKYKISFRPLAEADLFALYRYIRDEAGHGVAGAYIERLETACLGLETFPERGQRRDDIREGIRTVGFEGRATIVFQVRKTEVVIVRIFYGGQDYEAILGGKTK
jgi:toxin ParE1/3/4